MGPYEKRYLKMELPDYLTAVGKDNTPVVIPMWMADEISEMLWKYTKSDRFPMLAAYAFQEKDVIEDFSKELHDIKYPNGV